MSVNTYWLLNPSGQHQHGEFIDDTCAQRAAERGMLSRLTKAADFPRQRVEVLSLDDVEVELNELYYRRGWTDGLPVLAPTLARVDEMLEATEFDRAHVVAELEPLRGLAVVEKLAANAVMAGCRPEHFPVVLAAVKAIAKPEFNLRGVQTTDENVTPAIVVSSRRTSALDVNASFGALGPGWRGGAAIGRAVRLIMQNIGGGWQAAVSLAGLGQPGRFSLCFAEHEHDSPWDPLRIDHGFAAEETVITMFRAETVVNVTGGLAELASVMGSAASAFSMAYGGHPLVVISPFTANKLAADGMSKTDVQSWLFEHGRVPRRQFESFWLRQDTIDASTWPSWLTASLGNDTLPVVEQASDISIVVAGGDLEIAQQAYLPTWGFPACRVHQAVTGQVMPDN
tara:strand:+ start:649 stop:1842 length:1194 start_codon:yes stop_codon:yes gene_type:complete